MDTPYQKAFTMIELVFVIVIIGILAAVAIPKLAATRDDAKVSAIISHARKTLGDFQAFYTSQGNDRWTSVNVTEATSVPLEKAGCTGLVDSGSALSPTTFVLCHDNVVCLTFTTINEGNLTITDGTDTTDYICEAVKADPAISAISNKSYRLGGETVVR
ncbi:hypothetical protein YH65_01550 [Sulfurovum lithotrophicum]|uniref:Prepilin-type cleavage/methylation domain-containing protein n=1 Tax=Sulfurovum lithotrophicum TaxID=206403 RepID=A0A7U4RPW9_9BACT|nr:type II secretion system protein [Sulfurovum lithotrophicum]AKF24225.1 hypothetical protein YH65_01550 [Sulfurovum lithotrophicum]